MPGLHQQCLPHQQLTASLFPDHPLQTLLKLRTEILRIEDIQAAIHKSERIGRADHSSHVQGEDTPLHHAHSAGQVIADMLSLCLSQVRLHCTKDNFHIFPHYKGLRSSGGSCLRVRSDSYDVRQ